MELHTPRKYLRKWNIWKSENVFYKKLSPKLKVLGEKILYFVEIKDFGTFWGPGIGFTHKIQYFPWRMSFFGQKYFMTPKVETP